MNQLTLLRRFRFICGLAAHFAALSVAAEHPNDRTALLREFQTLQLVPASGGFLIAPGKLPELRWERPYLVKELFGEFPLHVRWFDTAGNEVTEAKLPGRYGAYIEGKASDGTRIRRAATLFCIDPMAANFEGKNTPSRLVETRNFGLSEEVWEAHREAIDRFVLDSVTRGIQRDPHVAVLAAGIAEWVPTEPKTLTSPSARNQEYHLRLKRRILGVEDKYPSLQRPQMAKDFAPELLSGMPAEAGFDDRLPSDLKALCERWHDEAGEPFTIVVARRGIIIFHEAYGERDGQNVTRNTAYPLFSLTKGLTGIMLAQFLDQELLELDQPLGEVLPDLPTKGEYVITLRHCMMHMTGLEGHGRWGGPDNPWLENVVANGLDGLEPHHRYSGVGFDLAGTAMQLVSGKSVPRLFHEHLFEPLGFENARISDLGSGGHLRAIDLARLGQLLLNEGSYGQYEFFNRHTFEAILPKPYADFFPGNFQNSADYGLGLYWKGEPHPLAGKGSLPGDATILSSRTLGHGAYSGTVFRVDLENEIVLAVGRFNSGKNHEKYVQELLMKIIDALPKPAEGEVPINGKGL